MTYHVPVLIVACWFIICFTVQNCVRATDGVHEAMDAFEGITWSTEGGDQVKAVVGPLPDTTGLKAIDESTTLEFVPDIAVASRGSFTFWFRVHRTYHAGREVQNENIPILSSPGIFEISARARQSSFGVFWTWDDVPETNNYSMLVPGLPGPGWYHLAFEWDSEQGIFNAYLNGTPLRLPGTTVDAWQMPEIESLKVHVAPFALAKLRLSQAMLDPRDLRRQVTQLYQGSFEYLLGARSLGKADIDSYKGELIYENPLANPADVEDWVLEGPGEITFDDGWMKMASQRPDGPQGHIVYWCPVDFPESYVAEWEIQPISRDGLCIVFFSATGRNGEDIFDPSLEKRDGVFSRYHSGDINCYHISYYANTPAVPGRITSNMRKNHGFYLITNGPPGIPPRSRDVHIVQLMKNHNHIQFSVDGRLIIDFDDDGQRMGPVLGGGKIGLRQMQWMKAQYRNLRIYNITD